MLNLARLLVLLLLCGTQLIAKSGPFEAAPPDGRSGLHLPDYVETFRLSTGAYEALRAGGIGDGYVFELTVPILGAVTIDAEQFTVLTDDARILNASDEGEIPTAIVEPLFFSGRLRGLPESFVYLMLTDTEVHGTIEFRTAPGSAMQEFNVCPVPAAQGATPTIMIARVEDTPGYDPAGDVRACGTEESIGARPEDERRPDSPQKNAKGGSGVTQVWDMKIAHIAVDCNYYVYTAGGSNFQNAAHRALFIVGGASAVYRRDVQMGFKVPYLRIWTKEPVSPEDVQNNPYRAIGSTSACTYRSNSLGYLRNHWFTYMGHVERHVAVLFSATGCGGVASDIGDNHCQYTSQYNMSCNVSNINYWNNLGSIQLLSHELGHNFGSSHTHSCVWTPPIDSCSDGGSCIQQVSQQTGTIMSYCNPIENRFHARVQQAMRTHIDNNACILEEDHSLGFDCEVTSILVPQPGATVYNGSPGPTAGFQPQAAVKNIGTQPMVGIPVEFRIIPWGGGTPVYTDVQVADLSPDQSAVLTFVAPQTQNLPLSADAYQAVVVVNHPADGNAFNDIMTMHFQVTDQAPTDNISVVSPSGTTLYAGTIVPIEINVTQYRTIQLDYSSDNGISWTPVGRLYSNNTTETYEWTVPSAATLQGRIRASIENNPAVSDQNDQAFYIVQPHDIQALEFVTPIAGSTTTAPFVPQVQIRNNGDAPLGGFPVFYSIRRVSPRFFFGEESVFSDFAMVPSINPGITQTLSFAKAYINHPGEFIMRMEVVPPIDMNLENNHLERVFNVSGSTAPFVVMQPVGDSWLQPGLATNIQWIDQSGQPLPTVDIHYSVDGNTWVPIALNAPNTGNVNWTVPDDPAERTARVRVQAPGIPPPNTPEGRSEFFSIRRIMPPLNVAVEAVAINDAPRMHLSWEASNSLAVDEYEIWRSVNGGAFTLLTTVQGQQSEEYNDDNVQNCNSYTYQLKAVVTLNFVVYTSDFSNPATAVALPSLHLADLDDWHDYPHDQESEPYGLAGIRSARQQMIITAGELSAGGFAGAINFTDLAFHCAWAEHGQTLENFTIRLKHTAAGQTNTAFETSGFSTVFGPADVTPVTGWNTHNFHTPFDWNGSANILVEICWTTPAALPTMSHCVKTQYPSNISVLATSTADDACSATTGVPSRRRPNILLQADRPALAVSEPNGGERFLIGSHRYIHWDVGCILNSKVKIEYSTNSGGTWIIISPNASNTGSYYWLVPGVTTVNARVRVSSSDQPQISDASDADFTINAQQSTLNISQPGGGSIWQAGENRSIVWSTTGSDPVNRVDIHYSTDGGAYWYLVAGDIPNNGSFSWTVPLAPGTNVTVRVRDKANHSIEDISAVFQLTPVAPPTSLTATPDNINLRNNLSWTASTALHTSGYVILRGADASSLGIVDVVGNVTSYIDDNAATCTDYTYAVKTIAGGYNSAKSNTDNAMITPGGQPPFEVTSPNGGEALISGTQWEITWNVCTAGFSNARLEYSLNNGVTWISIAASVANTGTYLWTVPGTGTQSGLIRVSDAADPATRDISDAVFSIAAPVSAVIAGGRQHTAIIKPSTNKLWLWGANFWGGLGDGTTNPRTSPQELQSLTNVTQVSLGVGHTLALANNQVYAWGYNGAGQLGDGTNVNKYTPTQITAISNVKAVYANKSFSSFALKHDGTLWSWGVNYYGLLGDGTTVDRNTPVQVSSLSGVTQFAGGYHVSYALKSDGTVWAWGSNVGGYLGIGQGLPNQYTPTLLPNLSNIVQIAARSYGGAALKSDGTVWVWGKGCVGNGNCNVVYTPVQIANFSGVKSIACGEDHTIALKHDGSLWAWGENGDGQLGDGTTIDTVAPKQVSGVSNIMSIAAGEQYSLLYRANGELCLTGQNGNGQLGDGTTTNRTSFTCLQQSFLRPAQDGDETQPDIRIGSGVGETAHIYPNPGDGRLTIELALPVAEHLDISIVDLLGREVWRRQQSGAFTAHSIPVDLRAAPRGVYIIRIVRDYRHSSAHRVTFR